jgi:ZIP family zinc transporter
MNGSSLLTVLAIAGSAALASILGGAIALWRAPTTLFMSLALGFASGILLATITFEMLPLALDLGSLTLATGGFVAGMIAVYALDLFIHRGRLAGEKSQQRPQVERFHRYRRPRGTGVTVLASGTSIEELIEGLSIGVGAAIKPGVGLLIGIAIAIDNLSEGLSIGELIRSEASSSGKRTARRVLGWTGLIGFSVLSSALLGWFLLRELAQSTLSFLFAMGAGGMFYLTITDLLPESEERHYQQSSALAVMTGFVIIFVVSQFT